MVTIKISIIILITIARIIAKKIVDFVRDQNSFHMITICAFRASIDKTQFYNSSVACSVPV